LSLPMAAASHPHPSLAAAAASAVSQGGGGGGLMPGSPQRTTLPGAFAVGGSDVSQIGDDGNHTITSPPSENISVL
jgi:hypothetical protein